MSANQLRIFSCLKTTGICLLFLSLLYLVYSTLRLSWMQDEFEYIVVGAGSAGSIIAANLAKNGQNSVLLLEAGGAALGPLHVPSFGPLLHQTFYNWNYKTVPQTNACLALNSRRSVWPMGKIMGGTSMLNNMMHVRGHKRDFDEWFKDKDGYSYADVIWYFKRLEQHLSPGYEGAGRSRKPIFVSDLTYKTDLPNVVLEAAKKLGYKTYTKNINSHLGFSHASANLYHGKRWTSALNLENVKGDLRVETNALVDRILLNSNLEAYGVQFTSLFKRYKVLAKKGVILAAGAVGTPKLLMLSGIGRKDHLSSLGIETVVDLPVGENLQDHLTTGMDLILLNHSVDLGIWHLLSPLSMYDYYISGSGPWTTTGCEAMAFFNTEQLKDERPDLQFMIMPLGLMEDKGIYLRRLLGISDKTWSEYFSKIQSKTITILPVLLHPKSKGTVRLKSKHPADKPLIDPRYLTHLEDVDILITGIKLIKALIESDPFKAWGASLNSIKFPGCTQYPFDSREYWECYIRHLSITAWHPVGTCKMGSFEDSSTVVDFNFQVKGTRKLFVVDGSVLPSLPSGNINAPIMMLAEMASDIILNMEYLNSQRCDALEIFRPKIKCY